MVRARMSGCEKLDLRVWRIKLPKERGEGGKRGRGWRKWENGRHDDKEKK